MIKAQADKIDSKKSGSPSSTVSRRRLNRRKGGTGVHDRSLEIAGADIVKQRYPDAEAITHLETRHFMDGKFVSFSYNFAGESDENLIYIYFDGVDKEFSPRVCETEDEFISLANDLRARQSDRISHRIVDYVFKEGGAAVVIALVLVLILAYAFVRGNVAALDEKFWNVFLLVVGFYFGANAPNKTKQ